MVIVLRSSIPDSSVGKIGHRMRISLTTAMILHAAKIDGIVLGVGQPMRVGVTAHCQLHIIQMSDQLLIAIPHTDSALSLAQHVSTQFSRDQVMPTQLMIAAAETVTYECYVHLTFYGCAFAESTI